MTNGALRITALIKKESLQIIRDPSSIIIAFILPLIFLVLFGYGISLDIDNLKIGVVNESSSPEANDLFITFVNSKYFKVIFAKDRSELEQKVTSGKLNALVVIPYDFAKKVHIGKGQYIQALICGSESNTAELTLNYIEGAIRIWLMKKGIKNKEPLTSLVDIESRVWFNEEAESRSALLPGSIALIMTLIGTMLTSLVIAREWERGTMEALLATPVNAFEFLLGKFIPYFFLGMIAMGMVTAVSTLLIGVPFRGSLFVLIAATSIYLCAALGLGLLISTLTRNQLVATQISLILGYLPSLLLSGIVFEVKSMPFWIRMLAYCTPPLYFVSTLQTLFLVGNVWRLIIPDMLLVSLFGLAFLSATIVKTKGSLDDV